MITLITGLFSILTPTVFPILLISFFSFAKLSKNWKEHLTNISLFTVFYIVFYYYLTHKIIDGAMSFFSALDYRPLIIILEVLTIIFAIWLTGFLNMMVEEGGIKLTNQIFRFVGLIILCTKLVFASFSGMGPIIGSLLIRDGRNYLSIDLLGFIIGVILPFLIIIGFSNFIFEKNRSKKWISTPQVIIGLFLIASSIYKIYEYSLI